MRRTAKSAKTDCDISEQRLLGLEVMKELLQFHSRSQANWIWIGHIFSSLHPKEIHTNTKSYRRKWMRIRRAVAMLEKEDNLSTKEHGWKLYLQSHTFIRIKQSSGVDI